MVSRAGNVFDEGGSIKDTATQEALRKFIAGFVAFVAAHARR
jgi:hypothetical protein